MRNKILALILIAAPLGANAVPIVVGGQLLGATDVDVGGTLYDVLFVDGTCTDVFDGCDAASDFTFQTQALAMLAAQALLDDVFVDQISGMFDSVPSLTNGCPGIGLCVAFTPYQVAGTTLSHVFAFNDAVEDLDRIQAGAVNHGNFDLSLSSNFTWADWSDAAVSVPEPGTLALLGIGLAGMGLARRRKKA